MEAQSWNLLRRGSAPEVAVAFALRPRVDICIKSQDAENTPPDDPSQLFFH
jgi:hypothetical protein